jgi:pantetheine-phosphate adenylyltransferase
MKTVLFPGSFDPVTNGHIDVMKRALTLFDKVIVSVSTNERKCALSSVEERSSLLQSVFRDFPQVETSSFEGLLVNAVKKHKATAVIRGLRAISDFEYEFQMAMMNRELDCGFETIFLMASPAYSFVSSRMIKEIVRLGGDVSAFVPPEVVKALKLKNQASEKQQ